MAKDLDGRRVLENSVNRDLRADNERLRAALMEIGRHVVDPHVDRIASAALGMSEEAYAEACFPIERT